MGKANKLQLIIKLKDLKIDFEEPRILNMEDNPKTLEERDIGINQLKQ